MAACIRVTSELEAEGVRLAGLRNPIALVPNGVELPPNATPLPNGSFHRRRALFLSRLHPKKGLLNLIEAWNKVRPQGWELIIAGPDSARHLAEVQAKARGCGLDGTITFSGPIWGEAKTRLFRESDLFVLPSFSENFGLAVAEALACAVPVITTRATPWAEIEERNCGWWIDIGVAPLVHALEQAVSLSPAALREMGLRGRELIKTNYTWESSARKMVQVYGWVLGRNVKPDCVFET
jgi:glycosyltransferase involved in cell wall biosynthesis